MSEANIQPEAGDRWRHYHGAEVEVVAVSSDWNYQTVVTFRWMGGCHTVRLSDWHKSVTLKGGQIVPAYTLVKAARDVVERVEMPPDKPFPSECEPVPEPEPEPGQPARQQTLFGGITSGPYKEGA